MDKVGVANLALDLVGSKYIISSFNEDSNEARVITINYDAIRDECLGAAPWTFAQMRIMLAMLAETPAFTNDGCSIVYSKPNDIIRANFINSASALWKIEGEKILSDTRGLGLIYTFRNDDPSTYYAKFITALATRLASKICFRLSESVNKAKDLYANYQEVLLPEAIAEDSQQGSPLQIIQSDWDNARSVGAVTSLAGSQSWVQVVR